MTESIGSTILKYNSNKQSGPTRRHCLEQALRLYVARKDAIVFLMK
jgi:hypothetical protein